MARARDTRAIFGCGSVILLSLVGVTRIDARTDTAWFLGLMGVASVAYVVVLWIISRGRGGSRRALAVCAMLAIAWRLALMGAAPLVSDDVFRYVWDGRVQRAGLNPYETVPDDPALVHLHTDVTRRIDPTSAELPTIYPPAAELFFRAVTALHPSPMAIIVAIVLCDLLAALAMWRWLVATGRDPWWVLAYLWHPLVALEGAGGGHVDLLGTLLIVLTVLALVAGRTAAAALALSLSVSVKFLPLVLVPLLWRRVRVRDAVGAIGVFVLLYAPFVSGSSSLPIGSLGVYMEQWRFNGPLFALLESWLPIPVILGLAVLAGLLVATVARWRLAVDAPQAWAWPLAAALLFMPAVYPWHLVWLTPFLMVWATRPLVVWTVASMVTYVVWASQLAGHGWVLPGWVVPLEYGAVAATALWAWRARRVGMTGAPRRPFPGPIEPPRASNGRRG